MSVFIGTTSKNDLETWKWQIELLFQGSLIILGLLIIFSTSYNKWYCKNQIDLIRLLKIDKGEIRRLSSSEIIKIIDNLNLTDLDERDKLIVNEIEFRDLFLKSIQLLIIVVIGSIILIIGVNYDAISSPSISMIILVNFFYIIFLFALIFASVFIYQYSAGFFTVGEDSES